MRKTVGLSHGGCATPRSALAIIPHFLSDVNRYSCVIVEKMKNERSPIFARGILRHEKVRFAAVGAVNTGVDFGLLSLLALVIGWPILIANIVSTSSALAVSYILNKKTVFRSEGQGKTRQIVLFVVVTLTGLWVLQGLVIALVGWVLGTIAGQLGGVEVVLIGKIVATLASLTWNYLWYSKVVFPKQKNQ